MDFLNNAPQAPAGHPDAQAGHDDFLGFNPQHPAGLPAGHGEETSLDDLLAYFQTPQEPPPAPFAPMGEPESYPGFPTGEAPPTPLGDPATDAPFPAFGHDFSGTVHHDESAFPPFPAFGEAEGAASFGETVFPAFDMPLEEAQAAPTEHVFSAFGETSEALFPAFPDETHPAHDVSHAASMQEEVVFPAFGDAEASPFGEQMGPVFPAFDDTPPAFPAHEEASFPTFPAFGETEGNSSFGEAIFPSFDMPVAENTDEPVQHVFPAFGETSEALFPAFPDETHPAHDVSHAASMQEEVVFPAFGDAEASPFGEQMGPVFPAFEEPHVAAPGVEALASAPHETASAFAFDDSPPVFPAHEDLLFPAFDDSPPHQSVSEFSFDAAVSQTPVAETVEHVFPAFTDEPPAPFETPSAFGSFEGSSFPAFQPDSAATASSPIPQPMEPPHKLNVFEDLSALTGKQVVVTSSEDRRMVAHQAYQAMGALFSGLDEVQGKMASLYQDLQNAAVRRASVEEIQRIASELTQMRAAASESSDLRRNALFLRQVADAYMQLLQEI